MPSEEEIKEWIKNELSKKSIFRNLSTSNEVVEINLFSTELDEKRAIVITKGKTQNNFYYAIRLIEYKFTSDDKLKITSFKRFPEQNKGYSTLEITNQEVKKIISNIGDKYANLKEYSQNIPEDLVAKNREYEELEAWTSRLEKSENDLNNLLKIKEKENTDLEKKLKQENRRLTQVQQQEKIAQKESTKKLYEQIKDLEKEIDRIGKEKDQLEQKNAKLIKEKEESEKNRELIAEVIKLEANNKKNQQGKSSSVNSYINDRDVISTQIWLDQNYSKSARTSLTELDISNKNLEGSLKLEGFANLLVLDCIDNKIEKLNLSDCNKLQEIDCGFNQLTELDLNGLGNLIWIICNDNYLEKFDYSTLNPDKLTSLNISNNNLPKQDLLVFGHLVNLEQLEIGSFDENKVKRGIYNRFFGSLEPLKNLMRLEELRIDNTDVSEGVEYLPNSLKEISCSWMERKDSKVELVAEKLEQSADFVFDFSNKIGLRRKLDNKIVKRIADFDYTRLISEQENLLKKLMKSTRQWEWYKKNGLCGNCRQLNTSKNWCQVCSSQFLRQLERQEQLNNQIQILPKN